MNKEVKVRVRGYDEHREESFEYMFTCIELQEQGAHYGNGKHVHIINDRGQSWKYLDARYVKDYDFLDFIRGEFEGHYGKNLRQLEMFLEEAEDFNVCIFNQKYLTD